MNVTVNKIDRLYPWVGEYSNTIVLFVDTKEAILLSTATLSEEELVGIVDNGWEESDFTPCSVTLSSV